MPSQPAEPSQPATKCPPDPAEPPQLPEGQVVFVDAPGQPSVGVELALTPAHRSRGLMYRTHLASDRGMLFSWPDERVRSFWMKNTCLPLDMLFISREGLIAGVLEQVPTLNQLPRRIPCPAAHVLELNAGYVRDHGVRPGQSVRIEQDRALKSAPD